MDMDRRIRIPWNIWNHYAPTDDQHEPTGRRQNQTSQSSPPRTRQLEIRIPAHIWNAYALADDQPRRVERKRVSRATRSCNVKLSGFQYGGPARKQRGKYKNDISFVQPCFKPTCASCLRWHPHAVRENSEDSEEPATRDAPVRITRSMSRSMSRQQQRIVQLSFTSQQGKRRFAALIQRYERRQRRS